MYSVIIDTTGFPLKYPVYYYDAETKEERGKQFLSHDELLNLDCSEIKGICIIGNKDFAEGLAEEMNPNVKIKVVNN